MLMEIASGEGGWHGEYDDNGFAERIDVQYVGSREYLQRFRVVGKLFLIYECDSNGWLL